MTTLLLILAVVGIFWLGGAVAFGGYVAAVTILVSGRVTLRDGALIAIYALAWPIMIWFWFR